MYYNGDDNVVDDDVDESVYDYVRVHDNVDIDDDDDVN